MLNFVFFLRRGRYCTNKSEQASYEMTSRGRIVDDARCTYVIQNKGNPATVLADNTATPCFHDVANYGTMWRSPPVAPFFANGLISAEQTLDVLAPIRHHQHRCHNQGPGHICMQTPDYDIAAAFDSADLQPLHVCADDNMSWYVVDCKCLICSAIDGSVLD